MASALGYIATAVSDLAQDTDSEFVESWLASKFEGSDNTGKSYASVIRTFFGFYNAPLADLTVKEALGFANYLKTLPMKIKSRKFNLTIVKTFYNDYLINTATEDSFRRNPFEAVPKKFFGKEEGLSLKDEKADYAEHVYTFEQIKSFLEEARLISQAAAPNAPAERAFFYIALIQIFCAPRVSETCTIKVENVDFENRYVKSGLVRNAAKAGEVYEILPEVIAAFLQEYVIANKLTGWLFPGYEGKRVAPSNIMDKFMQCGLHSHHFRHTLTTTMAEYGVDDADIELLTNHKPTSVTKKFYRKMSPEARKKLYDDSLPPMYYDLLAWLETL